LSSVEISEVTIGSEKIEVLERQEHKKEPDCEDWNK
jgi:hypothetical protein